MGQIAYVVLMICCTSTDKENARFSTPGDSTSYAWEFAIFLLALGFAGRLIKYRGGEPLSMYSVSLTEYPCLS